MLSSSPLSAARRRADGGALSHARCSSRRNSNTFDVQGSSDASRRRPGAARAWTRMTPARVGPRRRVARQSGIKCYLGPEVVWQNGARRHEVRAIPADVALEKIAPCPRGLLRQMTKSPGPQVLVVVDSPNWSHDYKTRNLQRTLGGEYQILKRFQSDLTEADLEGADLILVYYWLQFDRMKHLEAAFMRNRRKLLIGVCSHFELEGRRRAPALATLRGMARAVFANNLLLYRELRPLLEVPVFYTPNGVATEFYRPAPVSSPPARPETFGGEGRGGLRSKLKARVSSIGGLLKGASETGAGGRAASAGVRVGWAGSLSNQGPEQRGFHDLIVPAVRSVKAARLVVAAREERWRGPDEMLEFYRSIDVYLCASHNEGTPNPCLEAAACGVPVVATRVGNMPELIRHGVNGLFVERNVSDIADKITRLRDDPPLRAELSRNMLASIRAWDWRRQAGNYRNMFETILNS